MTEKPGLDTVRLLETLDEIQSAISTLDDQITERLKELDRAIQQLKSFCTNTLEANQKIIFKEIKKLQQEEVQEEE